jgi:hypothetical protein
MTNAGFQTETGIYIRNNSNAEHGKLYKEPADYYYSQQNFMKRVLMISVFLNTSER